MTSGRPRRRLLVLLALLAAPVVAGALAALLTRRGEGVEARYARVRQGMPRAEVEALLGRPERAVPMLGGKAPGAYRLEWVAADGRRVAVAFDAQDRVTAKEMGEPDPPDLPDDVIDAIRRKLP